jgi:hypothetical protein
MGGGVQSTSILMLHNIWMPYRKCLIKQSKMNLKSDKLLSVRKGHYFDTDCVSKLNLEI